MSQEIIQIENGSGRIRIAGNPGEAALLFDGLPVAFTWGDCKGSVSQYLIRGTHPAELDKTIADIRRLVSGKDPEIELSYALSGLLELFENGQYVLQRRVSELGDIIEFDVHEVNDDKCHSYYPWNDMLVCTQPKQYLDEHRVQEYQAAIVAGEMPFLIVAGHYRDEFLFVLDGHHKLEAYRRTKISPSLIEILRVDSKAMTLEDGLLAFGRAKSMLEGYERVKTQYYGIPRPPARLPTGVIAELFQAVEEGRVNDAVSILSDNPGSVDEENEYHETPLIIACRRGHEELVVAILAHQPDTLHEASNSRTALHYAATNNHPGIVRILVNHGISPDIRNSEDHVPIEYAASVGAIETMRVLVELGANVNPKYGSALCAAATNGRVDAVRYLLSVGADPSWNRINKHGCDEIAHSPIRKVIEDYIRCANA